MNNYAIEGVELPTFQIAVEQLQQVVNKLSYGAKMFSLEAHFMDLDSMKEIADIIESNRFAFFGWKRIGPGQKLFRNEPESIKQMRLSFGTRTIKTSPNHVLPPYDWDGSPVESVNLTFSETFSKPIAKAHMDINPAIVQKLADIIARHTGGSSNDTVKSIISIDSKGREHMYIVTVPGATIVPVVSDICQKFALPDGTGSFELIGPVATLEKTIHENAIRLVDFPADCPSFNKAPFALERAGFLAPILNISCTELGKVATTIDRLGAKVTQCSVCRKYISWRLGEGSFSPRTQGNYVLISPHRSKYRMFVGFEQYADDDPSAKMFTTEAASVLTGLGFTLKKVAYLK